MWETAFLLGTFLEVRSCSMEKILFISEIYVRCMDRTGLPRLKQARTAAIEQSRTRRRKSHAGL